jgi:hypothetical protein
MGLGHDTTFSSMVNAVVRSFSVPSTLANVGVRQIRGVSAYPAAVNIDDTHLPKQNVLDNRP